MGGINPNKSSPVFDHTKRYCIIGAGFLGLRVARAFQKAGISFDCYEASDEIGGKWNLGSYDSTQLISSRSEIEYPDFPMDPKVPLFPSGETIQAYLKHFAQVFEIEDSIELSKSVTSILPLNGPRKTRPYSSLVPTYGKKGWKVTLEEGDSKEYSGVILTLDRLQIPKFPDYPGGLSFQGKTLHSIDYKGPFSLDGRRILVVGSGTSACNLAVEIARQGFETYFSVQHPFYLLPKTVAGVSTDGLQPNWLPSSIYCYLLEKWATLLNAPSETHGLVRPKMPLSRTLPVINSDLATELQKGTLHLLPSVQRIGQSRVTFDEQTTLAFDTILYATEFQANFPFLDPYLISFKNGKPNRIPPFFLPSCQNLYLFGANSPYEKNGKVAETSARLLANAILLQEKIESPLYRFFQSKSPPQQGTYFKTQATLKSLKKSDHLLNRIESRFNRTHTYPIPLLFLRDSFSFFQAHSYPKRKETHV